MNPLWIVGAAVVVVLLAVALLVFAVRRANGRIEDQYRRDHRAAGPLRDRTEPLC